MVGDTPHAGRLSPAWSLTPAGSCSSQGGMRKLGSPSDPGKGKGCEPSLRKFLFSSPFLQPFLIKQGQWVEFVKGKVGAEAPGVAFARGKPKWVRRLLVFSLHREKRRVSWAKGRFYPPAAMQPCLSWSRLAAAEDRKFVTSF